MRLRLIESTEIRVSQLAFGTASLHQLFRSRRRQRVLGAAASVGITHFDTSPYYGYGLAEAEVGRLLAKRREDFTLATKVGLYPRLKISRHVGIVWGLKALGRIIPRVALPMIDWQVKRARTSLQQSLHRLRTDYVDFVFLHEPDMRLIRSDEFLRWLESEQERGVVRSWGLAGVAHRVAPWVTTGHSLARVVQTQDSLDKREADFLLECGRNLQFTYGYLSSQNTGAQVSTPESVVRSALQRNRTGSVIFSTRRAESIEQIAKAVA